jgi:hypothetical protein
MIFSCEEESPLISVDDDNIFESDVKKNSPRIYKENGSFAFIVKAAGYSGNTSESVNFSEKKVAVTINLEDYSEGSCSIKIMSDYNHELFSEEISGKFIYSKIIELDNYPEQILINVDKLSGTLKFALDEED